MVCVLLVAASSTVAGRHHYSPAASRSEQSTYLSPNCRAHTASLADFGAVGDGTTSNTAAFRSAVDHLSQYSGKGGAMLYVPAGKWLTGPFNLTSHFTLFLHSDAVILGSQVRYLHSGIFINSVVKQNKTKQNKANRISASGR